MSTTTPTAPIARCPGRYDGQHGEFGPVTHQQCLGCQRRSTGWVAGHWYLRAVPEFETVCPHRLERAG